MTHARIRAAQGDPDGARTILEAVLARAPDDERALLLMHDLAAVQPAPAREERQTVISSRRPSDARTLAGRFRRSLGRTRPASAGRRIARLERWLRAVKGSGDGARPDGS